ncbi:hypothetical protein N7478_008758 [Penicillium angulare]|uniref:uncharacterized protein n=1 Tax=Penicillium angulare TaxID=116970 RepID=UPI002542187D|nr:uncharacterized protein N7478_008758 [Penicillium angulare]KAJ5273633.1 hypothetical protein N7478_008758 [Penicillium angulare]
MSPTTDLKVGNMPPLEGRSINASVWDSVYRSPVKFGDLDLKFSHEDELHKEIEDEVAEERTAEMESLKSKKRKLDGRETKDAKKVKRNDGFKPRRDEIIWDISKVPERWHPAEPDLKKNDIYAQIDRCFDRIEEGIMPQMFESRMRQLEKERIKLEWVHLEAKNSYGYLADPKQRKQSLTPVVVKRLAAHEEIWDHLNARSDPFEQLPNIENVMDAYRRGKLRLTGLVTYWSRGKQLCQPTPFKWDEFEAINHHFEGSRSFWVEGLNGPSPDHSYYALTIPPSTYYQFLHTYHVAYRLPGSNHWGIFEVLYDTGATMARIFGEDLMQLQNNQAGLNIPVLGSVLAADLNTFTNEPVVQLEVCLVNPNDIQVRVTPWIRFQCMVSPGACPTDRPARLDGPWLRQFMYTTTQPDGQNRIHMATKGGDLPRSIFGMLASLQPHMK